LGKYGVNLYEMKKLCVKGYSVKIYNDGEIRIFTSEDIEDENVAVIAQYLYDEGFIKDGIEEVSIRIIS